MDTRPTSARASEDGFGSARMERRPRTHAVASHTRTLAQQRPSRRGPSGSRPLHSPRDGIDRSPNSLGGIHLFWRPGSDTEASPSPRLDGPPARLFLAGLRGAGIPGSRAPSSVRSVSPVLSEGG
ncbi:hypothetical protein VaNZ11_016883 [Volvox africanus]|uniref:Uncharacterized protein n=1 Tax=Volvox africanus TaxID=51714 RepID=A0ABQ5SQG0_9CHLO|nr:hypothetical protein VaNZ11_016883 [Volvox africanus]